MTIGIYLLIILALGYFTVYLREKYLDFKWMMPLTWLGIFIHETSHAAACILTGGRVTGFRVTSREGYVTHYVPKVPVLGPMLTAIAPMIGGLTVIGILNHFWLKTSLGLTSSSWFESLYAVLHSINLLSWQGWVLLILFLNIGVMVGPSLADLKSIWPLVVLSFFIQSESIAQVLALIIALVLINVFLFSVILLVKFVLRKYRF